MIGETPTFAASAYASRNVPVGELFLNTVNAGNAVQREQFFDNGLRAAMVREGGLIMPRAARQNIKPEEASMPAPALARRLVKVIIVDPNDNIPLDQCLLYSGEEKLTDATDTELFYEIDIKDVLAKHNERRVLVRDKSVKERSETLEPAKIRDLKMVVVTIASF